MAEPTRMCPSCRTDIPFWASKCPNCLTQLSGGPYDADEYAEGISKLIVVGTGVALGASVGLCTGFAPLAFAGGIAGLLASAAICHQCPPLIEYMGKGIKGIAILGVAVFFLWIGWVVCAGVTESMHKQQAKENKEMKK